MVRKKLFFIDIKINDEEFEIYFTNEKDMYENIYQIGNYNHHKKYIEIVDFGECEVPFDYLLFPGA